MKKNIIFLIFFIFTYSLIFAASGDDCSDPILVTLPSGLTYSDIGQTTCGRGNDYDLTCLGDHDDGEDIIYKIIVTTDVTVDITLDPDTTHTGICIDDECPPADPCIDYATSSSSSAYGMTNVVLTTGTYYIMIDNQPAPGCITSFDLTISASPDMQYTSSTVTQDNTAAVYQGDIQQEIIGIEIVTSRVVNPLSVTSFTLNTSGTTSTSDISNAKLWYTGTSSTFADTSQFGSVWTPTSGSHVLTSTQILAEGTNYFWLTYDITSGATDNNVVDAQCTSLTVDSVRTPTVTNPAGNRRINPCNYGGGGTNEGGYYYANSLATEAPSHPTYNWIDYSGHTEIISWTDGGTDDTGYFQVPDIGFNFTFFGNTYKEDNVYINTDGDMTFGSGYSSTTAGMAQIISTDAPNNLIAGCMMDLDDGNYNGGGDGKIYYGGDSSQFVVTYYHYHDRHDDSEWMTFQIILYPSGNIKVQYNETESTISDESTSHTVRGDALIGIEDSNGTHGICYRDDGSCGPIFGSNLALEFGLDDGSLPVTLSSFTVAVIQDELISINWTTQSETNNIGWNLYRSETNNISQAFQINSNMILGAGTSTVPTEYEYIDEYEVDPGETYWYWLESREISGFTEIYGPISLYIPLNEDGPDLPDIPEYYGLFQNYPNPFNPETIINYNLEEAAYVTIKIYNMKGELVRTLVDDYRESAFYSIIWDVKDESCNPVRSGIYFYKMTAGKYSSVKKMILLK